MTGAEPKLTTYLTALDDYADDFDVSEKKSTARQSHRATKKQEESKPVEKSAVLSNNNADLSQALVPVSDSPKKSA